MLTWAAQLSDRLEHLWEERFMRRTAGTILVIVYLATIVVIELNRQGIVPPPLNELVPTNHFYAVEIAFTVLLFTEVLSLIFGLTHSFSRSIGIQLEILCLILLRDTFKQFTSFSEPLEWDQVVNSIEPMVADAIGALLIFFLISLYYRQIRSARIMDSDTEQAEFIALKKLIALSLIGIFALVAIVDLYRLFAGLPLYPFFETFYTILVFTDVLMVLLSLRYSHQFAVIFRNFGFAVVTVAIRLTLIAPTLIGVLMGISTALFALVIAWAYNQAVRMGTPEIEKAEELPQVVMPKIPDEPPTVADSHGRVPATGD